MKNDKPEPMYMIICTYKECNIEMLAHPDTLKHCNTILSKLTDPQRFIIIEAK